MSIEPEESPIIIYGAARSGTTYLTHLMNHHPDVFISDETRIFVWAHRTMHDLLNNEPTFFRLRNDFESYLRAELPALIRGFYAKLSPARRYWGDKNPHYVADGNEGCLQTILELFPGARFIHIIRDGRDVVCSGMRRGWKHFDGVHQMWTSHVNRGCAFGRRLPANRYFELRYEELVRDDLGMARRLFQFLGVEMHSNVATWCERQREQRTPLCRPTRDIVADVTSSDWSTFLSPDLQLRSLELLGRELVDLGYESEQSFRRAFQQVAEQHVSSLLDRGPGEAQSLPQREAQPAPRGEAPPRMQVEVQRVIPAEATVLVVSRGDDELLSLGGRTAWHFPRSEDGTYAGYYPAGSADAIAHLELLRSQGAEFLVFPQAAFWWLDHYDAFRAHLESQYRAVACSAHACLIFDLRAQNLISAPTGTGRALEANSLA
jgi:hypothetical protein